MSESLVKVFSELENELAELRQQIVDDFEFSSSAMQLTEDYLAIIEEKLKAHIFSSKEDEIIYFKTYFPKIFKLYYLHKSIAMIEKEKYLTCFTKSEELLFYTKCIQRINNIYDDELLLLNESKALSNKKKKRLFLRKHYRWRRNNLSCALNENYITNSISIAIGKRESIPEVIQYIEHKISVLNEFIHQKDNSKKDKKYNLRWTSSKVLLVELIYALYLSKTINDGRIELQELVEFFEDIFNIDLHNHNNVIQNIKARKSNKTKFIDLLRDQLNAKLID